MTVRCAYDLKPSITISLMCMIPTATRCLRLLLFYLIVALPLAVLLQLSSSVFDVFFPSVSESERGQQLNRRKKQSQRRGFRETWRLFFKICFQLFDLLGLPLCSCVRHEAKQQNTAAAECFHIMLYVFSTEAAVRCTGTGTVPYFRSKHKRT